MLDSIAWFPWGPVGIVQGLAKVVPDPGAVVEDVGQADPEAKVGVSIPAPTLDLLHDGILLLLRINFEQIATALLALSPRGVPGGVPLLEEVAACVK